jgi:2-haloacid dehalogenase
VTPPSPVVCFDVMGTVFDLSPIEDRLREAGARFGLDAWFAKTLHAAAALTLTGSFAPFPEVAGATLRSLLARSGSPEELSETVLATLAELDPYPDAADAFAHIAGAGGRIFAVTNGTERNTRALFERSGLARHVEAIAATEHVGAYKPHRAVYDRAVDLAGAPASAVTMIAAHGWDVAGAGAAGLRGLWVSRTERRWPLPGDPPVEAPDLLTAARLAV